MNERIRELAEHCFDITPDHNGMRDFIKLILWDVVSVHHSQLAEARFNESVHLGLGDVRYTVGMESEFEELLHKHFGLKDQSVCGNE